MQLTVRRVKLGELELLVVKVILVMADKMVILEMLVNLGNLGTKEKRVIQAAMEGMVPLALLVVQDQREKLVILETQGRREKRDLRGLMVDLDGKAKGEGEETTERKEAKVPMGRKETRETEGHWEAEVDPGKTDLRGPREPQDYQGREVRQESQGGPAEMAP